MEEDTDIAARMARLVGRHHRVGDYEVGREKIREFARAVLDSHPAHHREDAARALGYAGLIGPVTFVSILGSVAIEELFDVVLVGYNLSQLMHTDQQLILHRPVTVGDRLNCDVYLESFRQMGGTDIIVTTNLITDQHEQPVATTRTTFIARTGGVINTELAKAVADVMMHKPHRGPVAIELDSAPG
ncbi:MULTISPECIES: (3R)-hydroxyacyl-ACP dehydratase subunit HadA [unclassified Rhodococcus (in: high G+C Gram-positive bacteria)]|uniref:(3R)-hydroxyacyl-ACP dehydratase subunit HadA n=1 Tax=unclassified Rhodococcus (in: high G+C Gram-positive bacteria) TaxID=192944 RepID=UPI001639BCFA|nr:MULTISPECIES: (3R)-hydroxyacyl-ACP dehydratase subunit HadA [unclassified Rhodococcus (in: high G+C Gram-positive bacteria)]MBC2640803.1 MaoC family dehydratase N-terminal domain-containing protein [Rhodococcus sp. 3A]MBC2894452.1 MaoC family dehydratase N-terminal domain-containing protein [Rhodococcus sp. 4CII]